MKKIIDLTQQFFGGGGAKKQLEIGLHYWEEVLNTLQVEDPYNVKAIKEAQIYIDGLKKKLGELAFQELEAKSRLAAETKKDIFPVSMMEKEEIEKDILEFHKLIAEAENLREGGKLPSWEDRLWIYPTQHLRDITTLDLEFLKLLATVEQLKEKGEIPSWEDSLWNYPKNNLPDVYALDLAFNQLLATVEQLSEAGQMPDWRESLEGIPKGFVGYKGKIIPMKEYEAEVTQMQRIWDGFVGNISSSFQAGFFDLFKSGENKWKSFCDNLVNSFERALSQMITNYLMFGNLLGGGYGSTYAKTPSGGTGWLGLFGTFGSWLGFQEGGQFWVNRLLSWVKAVRENS
jgi:hypothetical protein